MTVIIKIGRRIPRSFFRRKVVQARGLLSFQENIWGIITQSLQMARKKAIKDGRMKFVLEKFEEPEVGDLNYVFQWQKFIIMGTPKMEEEEYNDSLKMYDSLGKIFKKSFDKKNALSKVFKTKILNRVEVDEAYKKGFGATKDKSISQKLLEMGILTHIKKIDDYEQRNEVFFD